MAMLVGGGDWIAREFAELDLGDKRLNDRTRTVVGQLSAKPAASIPMACGAWREVQAAYRLMDNEMVGWQDILEPHWNETEKRMARHPVVLVADDTTELDFNGKMAVGLGPLNYENRRGMYVHPSYAITPDREPLGLLNLWMWAREFRDENGVRPPALKESRRWVEGYENVAEIASRLPDTRLIYMGDREADLVAMMWRAHELGCPADWLIRAKSDRVCRPADNAALSGDASAQEDGAMEADDGTSPEGEKLWACTTSGEPLGEIRFMMPGRDDVKPRQVRQQLWARQVEISAGKGRKLVVTCVVAREIGAPKGVKPVEWRLLTNREAATLEDAIQLIDWYRCRWEIEMFFNVLKNGCKIEAMQLKTIDRIETALAMYMIVAWRVAHLMRLGRVCPDLDASLFFHPDEIKGAYLLSKKRPPSPEKPPSLNKMIRLVASLGGFLGRKSDGEPGAKTIWQGLQRVMDAATTIAAMRDGWG